MSGHKDPKNYAHSEKFECPHCGEEQDSTVDHYVVHDEPGAFAHNCWVCGKKFTVEDNGGGSFTVTPK
jgi:transcription elongation factor Elf1